MHPAYPLVLLLSLSAGICFPEVCRAAETEAVDFAADVFPLLEQRCLECHGEDRSGGLRLDHRRDALLPTDSGEPAIVPGDPKSSPLLDRITSRDAEQRMPPDDPPLTSEEVELLRRWIAHGAEFPEDRRGETVHWAYGKPQRSAPPDVQRRDWPRNPIDRFVQAKLESAGMHASEAADKSRRLRRASLALTGLPPSLEMLERFLADRQPDAYERAVDRLLESSALGEHWARHWLDLARYADSNGYQADQLRDSWAYRDWVIDALNADMPFDQFVVEQLAGDLLPEATPDQKIATGLHRATTCNVEAGVHPEENRVNQVFDRVNTTGTVLLGTTLECAQCHNHKYDPFTQREYYQFFAFFNNTPLEVEKNSGVQYNFIGPTMELPMGGAEREARDDLQQRIAALERQRAQLTSPADRKRWEKTLAAALDESDDQWQVLRPERVETTGDETIELLPDGSVLLGGPTPGVSAYTLQLRIPAGVTLSGIQLETLTHPSLPGKGPGRGDAERANFVLNELTVRRGTDPAGEPLALVNGTADFEQKGWAVGGAVDGDRNSGWAIAPRFHEDHWARFAFASPLQLRGADAERITAELDQNWGQGRTIGRVRLSGWTGTAAALPVPDEIAAILRKTDKKRTAAEREQLDTYYVDQHPELRQLDAHLEELREQLDATGPPTTLVMVELPEPRTTHVMRRGNYLAPGPEVEPATPAALHPFDDRLPRNRLGLARWIVHPDNPLLARVTVNRWWTEMFGRGLVETPEDFGTRADPPTHPELLDWLAVELVESGWSMKHVLRLIATSATFQQASTVTAEAQDLDPLNRLYGRGPRPRMAAETIRDQALAAAGLLSSKMHGSPVMPYQPEGVWRAVGRNPPQWKTADDADRFRRGVYVVWRRAAPYPSFVNFDAPDRASCTVRRPMTNTPLQALTLLNDTAYVEAALGLAYRTLVDLPHAAAAERVEYAFRCVLARVPTDRERGELLRLYQEERERFGKDKKAVDARLQASFGVDLSADLDRVDWAAWSVVCSVLLNLDETITRG